jgi:hypothetical protein
MSMNQIAPLAELAPSPFIAADVMPDIDFPRDRLALGIQISLGVEAAEFDYNNAARVVVSTVLGEVPVVGVLLSALVDIFWPNPEVDIWAQIEAKVEALINQKIAERVWQQVSESLAGLQNVLDDYLFAAKNFPNDPKYISEKFNVAQGHFLHDLPQFQSKGYELLLLPLFAQFANLHLGLLRDGAAFGANWGWSPEILERIKKQLSDGITNYGSYSDRIYNAGLADTRAKAPSNAAKTEPFNTVNRFIREMTLTVLDFRAMWPYYDIVKFPVPPKIYLDREIYSDAVGTSDDSPFSIPGAPSAAPTRVIVWGWDRIDAIQVDYPQGGGPDGKNSTGRMGNSKGGSDAPPHGGSFDVSGNPVTLVRARFGHIVNALWFQFKNGSWTHKLGGNYPGGGDRDFSYPGELLSSIKVMGVSRFYGSANCAVFGFKFEKNAQPTAELLQRLFRTSPQAVSATTMAQRLGASETVVRDVAVWAQQNHWDAAREHLWAQRAARVQKRTTNGNGGGN